MKDNRGNDCAFSEERRRINRTALLSVVIAAVMIAMFFVGYFVHGETETKAAKLLDELNQITRDNAVMGEVKTADELAELFVQATLKDDKYAKYYTPSEYAKILKEDKGRYSGVGVSLAENAAGTEVFVSKVYLNSPAYKKGVKEGDRLVAGKFKGETDYEYFADKADEYNADKEPEDKISVLSVVNDFFEGYVMGDELELKVMRGDTELDFLVKKENYTVSYVEYRDNGTYYYFSTEYNDVTDKNEFKGREPLTAAEKAEESIPYLDDDTAYIKLYEFEGDAAAQFAETLEFMNDRGRTKLILDLRDNGGGLVDILLEIASYIVNDNGSSNINILNVEAKSAKTHYSTSINRFSEWLTDISVIANGKTASASECLIGALTDYGDAETFKGASFSLNDRLILTEHNAQRDRYCTYGKGIMQTTYGLKSGGALKLTTAKIYWPKSNVFIQDKGAWTDNPANCVSDENAVARANAALH